MIKILKCLLLAFLFSGFLHQAAAQVAKPEIYSRYSRTGAQVAGRYPHIIKLNFLSPFALTANVAYEHFISPKLSFQVGVFYHRIRIRERSFFWLNIPNARYSSYAITPEMRYYTGNVSRTRLDGFFIAPFVRYRNTSIHINANEIEADAGPANRDFHGNLHSIRLGGVAGYKLVMGKRFSLEAFAGPSLRIVSWLNANLPTYRAESFLPFALTLRSGMTLGYAF